MAKGLVQWNAWKWKSLSFLESGRTAAKKIGSLQTLQNSYQKLVWQTVLSVEMQALCCSL